MSLTSLVNVKQWLDITNTNNDALLQRLIDGCSEFIESWLNRKIISASYVEYYDGSGSKTLTIGNYPITAVASISINGNQKPVLSLGDFSGVGVRFSERQLIGHGINFERGHSNVCVSYTAGYQTVPKDIEQACIEFVALRYKNGRGDRLGVSSKGLATESVSYFQGDMPPSAKTLLMQYRNVVPI